MAIQSTTEIKKGAANFRLVGKLKTTDRSFTLEKKSESGFISNQAYIGVECEEGNVVHARMFDGYNENKTLYVHGKKYDETYKRFQDDYKDQFQISWRDRFNQNILDKVGPSCFTTIGIEKEPGKDGKEEIIEMRFISQFDAIQYLSEALGRLSDEEKENLAVDVRGDIQYNYYDGKVTVQKTITSIKATKLPVEKFGSKFVQTCYINKDNIGEIDEVTNTKLVNVKIPEYVSKVDGIEIKRIIPLTLPMYLDLSKASSKILLKWFNDENQYGRYTLIGKFSNLGNTETIDLSNYSDEVRELIESGDWDEEESNPTVANNNYASEDMIITNIKSTQSSDDNNVMKVTVMKESDCYTISELENVYTEFQNIINPPESDDEMPDFDGIGDDEDFDWVNSMK